MSAGEIRYNDIGTPFRPTIKDQDGSVVDVSGATTLTIRFERPDGTTFDKDASLNGDGTDGVLKYVTVDGDLNGLGFWELQAYVETAEGAWWSDIYEFQVHENLAEPSA
jgi:hypothetical protein